MPPTKGPLAAEFSPALPMTLRRLRSSLVDGEALGLVMTSPVIGSAEGCFDPLLTAVLEGAGFDRIEIHTTGSKHVVSARRARSIADTVDADMSLLLVGLNPSPVAADAGVGFARPGNRFWPAALAAGLVDTDRDPERALTLHRLGMTDLVKRTTARADEVTSAEFRHGIERLDLVCAWLRPTAVCLVGLSGWRAAVDRRANVGWQERAIGGRPVFVMHNPSGLNAHVQVPDLAAQLQAAAAGPT